MYRIKRNDGKYYAHAAYEDEWVESVHHATKYNYKEYAEERVELLQHRNIECTVVEDAWLKSLKS